MCGISVYFHKQKISSEIYKNFVDSLELIKHRGPDDEGIVLINTYNGNYKITRSAVNHLKVEIGDWIENYNLILGHKRLSILELSSKGHQPMQGCDGSWVVFNGEIYNYIELREELKTLGGIFQTNSDTEVVLEAYRIWGTNCQNKFNGMWSICIWDAPQKKIFVSNDRFGVKSLYHITIPETFILSSEIKNLSNYKSLSGGLNLKHLENFYQHGLLDSDNQTPFNNIERFKKAHYSIINPETYLPIDIIKPKNYYQISKKVVIRNEDEAIAIYRNILNSAVLIRMRTDVKFGFALSGGVDSSSIIYTAKQILEEANRTNELIGFSAIFPGHESADESKFIKIIVDDLKLNSKYVNPMDSFSFDEFEKHVYHHDEPLQGTSYFAEWSIYDLAKQNGIKVLFNGQGADEVFAGYHHHVYKHLRELLINGKIREYVSLVNSYSEIKAVQAKKIHKIIFDEIKLSSKIKIGIKKIDNHLIKHWHEISNLNEMLIEDFSTYLLPTYLRSDDRDSMAFSIESRHPFMDYRMIEFGYSLPNNLLIKKGWQKYILRKGMPELPESIAFRKDKKGFTTPQDKWISTYKNNFEEYLEYNEKHFGKKILSNNVFYNYAMGAWLKVYEQFI